MKQLFWMAGFVAILLGCSSQQSIDLPPLTPTICGGDVSCLLGERSYSVRTPDNWNGSDPLPALIHFHGWGRQGRHPVRSGRVGGATDEAGVLLLAPDGIGKTWAFWRHEDRDIRFIETMLADAERRWPIDRSKVFVSGYSFGSLMALAVACDSGDQYAGFLGIGGLITYASRSNCKSGPVSIRNVHGLRDNVIDLPVDEGDDPATAMLPWVAISGCDPARRTETSVETVKPIHEYTEYRWSECANGTEVQIDIHGRGHFIPRGWVKRQLIDLLTRRGNA